MLWEEGVLKHKNKNFPFLKYGNGKRIVICFHGMHSNPKAFHFLQKHLINEYTFINCYLPHHHPQGINNYKTIKPEELMAYIQGLRNNFKIEKFDLWGHSLGARFCLKIVELQGDWVERLILFTPDGIAKNPWYNFATNTAMGRYIFKNFVKNPIKYIQIIEKLRLSSKNKLIFAKRISNKPEFLEKVFKTWTSMHYLVIFLSVVKRSIKKNAITGHIFAGKHDNLIPIKPLKKFTENNTSIRLHIFEKDHNILHENFENEFLNYLKQNK